MVVVLEGPSHSKVVACYFSTWAPLRTGRGKFTIDNIDGSLCTQLIYPFANLDVKNDTIEPAGILELLSFESQKNIKKNDHIFVSKDPSYNTEESIKQFTKLRQRFSHLKVCNKLQLNTFKNIVILLVFELSVDFVGNWIR